MTYDELSRQESLLVPLAIHLEQAKRLEDEAETLVYNSWNTHGRDFDETQLDELRDILRDAAEAVRKVLQEKISALPSDIDEKLLEAYGLRKFSQ